MTLTEIAAVDFGADAIEVRSQYLSCIDDNSSLRQKHKV